MDGILKVSKHSRYDFFFFFFPSGVFCTNFKEKETNKTGSVFQELLKAFEKSFALVVISSLRFCGIKDLFYSGEAMSICHSYPKSTVKWPTLIALVFFLSIVHLSEDNCSV